MASQWDLPSPWSRRVTHAVGGLTDVGTSSDGRFLLVVSHQGRGVYDLEDGTRVARDSSLVPESDRDDAAHTVAGIGPLADCAVAVAGLWGGHLPATTVDGWSISRGAQCFRLSGPGQAADLPEIDTDVALAGFVRGGSVLVYACSSDLTLWFREPAA